MVWQIVIMFEDFVTDCTRKYYGCFRLREMVYKRWYKFPADDCLVKWIPSVSQRVLFYKNKTSIQATLV